MWDVYKRIGRATPNKAFAVSTYSHIDGTHALKIVTDCTGWAAALQKAFPGLYENLETSKFDTIEDAQQIADSQDWNFDVTEIDEYAL